MAKKQRGRNRGPPRKKARALLDESEARFEKEVEAFGKRLEKEERGCRDWFYKTFGIVGPFFSAVVSLLLLSFGLWVLKFFVNGSAVLFGIHSFLLANIGIFFAIFLLSSYLKYFSIMRPQAYFLISPFSAAFCAAVFFWIMANAMLILSAEFGSAAGFGVANFILNSLFGIFWLFLLVGYFVVLLKMILGQSSFCAGESEKTATGSNARFRCSET